MVIPPGRRASDPLLHGVASSAVALAVGLPFLFVLTRTAQFYGYADNGFGFWLATRALPVWAVVSVSLGAITGYWSSRGKRSLGSVLARSGLAALLGAAGLTAVVLGATSPLRERYGREASLQGVSLGHFLSRHLFEKPSGRKLDFDLCMLNEEGLYGRPGDWKPLNYVFCVPDSSRMRDEVSRIDTTVRFESLPGAAQCGPGKILCYGNTRQGNAKSVLQRLSLLPYVRRIRGAANEQKTTDTPGRAQ